MSDTAVYTTIFPNALPFLDDFAKSLDAQSDQDFDLFVGLDRLTRDDVEPFFKRSIAGWFEHRPDDTPGRLRGRAFQTIASQNNIAVLVDSDDVLAVDRVQAAKDGLRNADVYACALNLVDESGASLGMSIAPPGGVDWSDFLARANVFGLSNTAYRCDLLAEAGRVGSSTGIVDWYLVSMAISLGGKLVFDQSALMDYRQYGQSTLETVHPYSEAGTRHATDLALAHYRATASAVERLDSSFYRTLLQRQDDVRAFKLFADGGGLASYIDQLNEMIDPAAPSWWWRQIAAPELEDLWRTTLQQ